ncbi:nucleoside diphosphate kinase regulator [Anaerosporomusa subterranea]|uniref:nucleoside diphosphate kinase regulator n=1 Tax=Anaerosporomusa subterranea TaxID=1794912 RepID=UPI001E43F282|nr:nucleoside diphosphate kinase regulator [Anaerosporomusa subterranea]
MNVSRKIYITEADLGKLEKLINAAKEFSTGKKEYLEKLELELAWANVVLPTAVPDNVITMNSKVLLRDLDYGDEMTYTLVYPDDADLAQDKISVLAPIGTAILGYRAGDDVEWEVPNGIVRLRVEKILYQPEAAGNFDL